MITGFEATDKGARSAFREDKVGHDPTADWCKAVRAGHFVQAREREHSTPELVRVGEILPALGTVEESRKAHLGVEWQRECRGRLA